MRPRAASSIGPASGASASTPALVAYVEQARGIEDYARAKAERHERVSVRNRRIRYCVGIPAAVLAFIAGSAAVADWSQLITAISAFVASALSTTLGFIKPEEGRVRHSQLRAEWQLIEATATDICADAEADGLETIRTAVRRLREQKHHLDRADV